VVRLTPPAAAVIVAWVVLETCAADAEKVALPVPAATVTVAGTVTAAWFEDKLTVRAEAAGFVSATVHVEAPPGFTLAGEQLREASAAGALVRPSEKVFEPPP
jgi:hypothetical protein